MQTPASNFSTKDPDYSLSLIIGGCMKSRVLIVLLLLSSVLMFAEQEGNKERQKKSKKQGWLGVSIQDVTPRFARDHELKIKEGAFINEVVEDSPADSAGLQEEDVIVEFNGKKIEASEDLTDAVRETTPGTKVNVKINRKGENKTIGVNVGKNKMRMPFAVMAPRAPRVVVNMFGGDYEGMELMELNKQLGEYFEAPNGKGVLVTDVEKDENASKAGIKAGDVITKIGDESIKDVEDVRDAFSDYEEDDKANIELMRKGKKITVTLEISEENEQMYWRDHMPGNFNFHFEPQMNQLHKEMEIRMKELPRRQKELQRIESKMNGKGV